MENTKKTTKKKRKREHTTDDALWPSRECRSGSTSNMCTQAGSTCGSLMAVPLCWLKKGVGLNGVEEWWQLVSKKKKQVRDVPVCMRQLI